MSKLLEINKLKTSLIKNNREIPIIDELNIHINKGEIVALVGESGCGKSITSLSILNLLPKQIKNISGEIKLEGLNILQKKEEELHHIRGKEIAMIFQEPMTSLNPVMRIKKQLLEAILKHKKSSKREALKEIIYVLNRVGFADPLTILKSYPHQLSGGMRQRIMIAMALLCQPKLIIADEPTTALDVTIQAQILQLLREIVMEYETSILFITHDLGVVAEVADRVIVMYAGEVVEEGSVSSLLDQPIHPYTKGLIASIPNNADSRGKLYAMKGQVPALGEWPAGCRFATRCSFQQDLCHQERALLYQIDSERKVRCHFTEEMSGRDE